jgi:hypothetical protein
VETKLTKEAVIRLSEGAKDRAGRGLDTAWRPRDVASSHRLLEDRLFVETRGMA